VRQMQFENRHTCGGQGNKKKGHGGSAKAGGRSGVRIEPRGAVVAGANAAGNGRVYVDSLAELSAFQAAPRKTSIAENSIHTIRPIAAARPP
jgi:hypothetical protein